MSTCLFAICASHFEKCQFIYLSHVFTALFILLLLRFLNTLYFLKMNYLSYVYFIAIFSHSVGCLCVERSLFCAGFLKRMQSYLSIFAFIALPKGSYPRHICLCQCLIVFLCSNFMGFELRFRFLIHCELVLVWCVGSLCVLNVGHPIKALA